MRMARINLFPNPHASESWWVGGSCMHAKSLQSCLTLCNPMDCTQPGYSVHGIPQTRILEWVATPFSRGSSPPRDGTCTSFVSCIDRWIFYHTKGRFGFNRTWGRTWNSTLLKGSKRADIADQWEQTATWKHRCLCWSWPLREFFATRRKGKPWRAHSTTRC